MAARFTIEADCTPEQMQAFRNSGAFLQACQPLADVSAVGSVKLGAITSDGEAE